jgi:hypothetical protein
MGKAIERERGESDENRESAPASRMAQAHRFRRP